MSNPLLEQAQLEQGAQESVQEGFECLQGRRLYNLPGQPVPLLCHPHRKEDFSHVEVELPVFQLVPVALVLPLGTIEKSLVPSS